MSSERKLPLREFLADRPVFTLAQLAEARGDGENLQPARNQLKHHLRSGRVLGVARGVFAAVPPGVEAERFAPDPFLVAAAVRPEGVFAYHSALELLGQAHSMWQQMTLHCRRRRPPLAVGNRQILFLAVPTAIERADAARLGVREVVRGEARLPTTGPERTLVEGFRQPHRVGGLDELVESVLGFADLDFALLRQMLEVYDERALWAAVGWLTQRQRDLWRTPSEFVARCRRRRPRRNQYLLRESRGGMTLSDWNLIVPGHLAREVAENAGDF